MLTVGNTGESAFSAMLCLQSFGIKIHSFEVGRNGEKVFFPKGFITHLADRRMVGNLGTLMVTD